MKFPIRPYVIVCNKYCNLFRHVYPKFPTRVMVYTSKCNTRVVRSQAYPITESINVDEPVLDHSKSLDSIARITIVYSAIVTNRWSWRTGNQYDRSQIQVATRVHIMERIVPLPLIFILTRRWFLWFLILFVGCCGMHSIVLDGCRQWTLVTTRLLLFVNGKIRH